MAMMLNFEVIFDKFKMYEIISNVKLTTMLTDRRIKKLCSSKVDFMRSGWNSAY
jgi:hypothetical protein